MINTKDIYYKVDSKIVDNGFWSLDLSGKIRLVENELINYTLSKFPHLVKESDIHKIDLDSLLLLVNDEIPSEEKDNFFMHYTHYILKIISSIQNHEVIWMVENDENLISEPQCIFNNNDKLDILETHISTSPLQITQGIIKIFKFELLKKNIQKQLVLK